MGSIKSEFLINQQEGFQKAADLTNHLMHGFYGLDQGDVTKEFIKEAISNTRKNSEACNRVAQFFTNALASIYKKCKDYPEFLSKIQKNVDLYISESIIKAGVDKNEIIKDSTGLYDVNQLSKTISKDTLSGAVKQITIAINSLALPDPELNFGQELLALKLAAEDPLTADYKMQAKTIGVEFSKNTGTLQENMSKTVKKIESIQKWSKPVGIFGYVLGGFGLVRTVQKMSTKGAWKGFIDFWSNMSLFIGAIMVGLSRGVKKAKIA